MTARCKVLITGATGFVGTHLTQRLVLEGFEARALARSSSDVSSITPFDVEIVYGDIRDPEAVRRATTGCHHVYHLATSRSKSSQKELYAVNVQGTKNLCHAAVKANIERFVHASSCGIYGNISNLSLDENTPPAPDTHFQKSKLLAESEVSNYFQNHGLPAVVARFSYIYGPRSLKWLKMFQKVAAKRFRLIGSGKTQIQPGYVSDIVEGIRLCGETQNIKGRTYIISGSERVTLNELLEQIAEAVGTDWSGRNIPAFPFHALQLSSRLLFRYLNLEIPFSHQFDFFLASRIYNIARAKTELGYVPQVSIKDGISLTAKWYCENGYL